MYNLIKSIIITQFVTPKNNKKILFLSFLYFLIKIKSGTSALDS